MVIRKLYKFCSGHIVRNCSSDRCKRSMHGHNYVVEVLFTSNKLDNGGMVLDFGLTKGVIKDFIDGFDHCWQYWSKDTALKNVAQEHSARWIEMPVSPSAENYSLMFFYVIDAILNATEFNNGEGAVTLYSVRVHETDTGYAESFREDLEMVTYKLDDIKFSQQVKDEWVDSTMYDKLLAFSKSSLGNSVKPFVNPIVDIQIKDLNVQ